MTLFVTGVLIALVVSALCSVMEATLLSLTPAQVAGLSKNRPRIGRIWQGFKNDVERPIAVILLLNTTAHTIGASIAGAQFGKVFGEEHLWLFAMIFTFVMLQFTEILAKSLGVRFNSALALFIGRPLQVCATVFQPLLWLIHLINRPFEGRRRGEIETPATIEEIAALAGLARLSSQISPQQERIIATAPRLSATKVSDILVPRANVAWLDTNDSVADAIDQARRHLHTRVPVCDDGDLNRVVGYVNIKEMLLLATGLDGGGQTRLPVRAISSVRQDDSAAEVLTTFVRERVHIAIVKDEAGETTGLITLEDVLEELLGDIRDEFDGLPRHFHPAGEDRWTVGGGMRMKTLASELGSGLPETDQSLAAWLEERVEDAFQVGATAEVRGLRFVVRRLRRGSLYECTVERIEETE